jgi:hypothetical protein
LFDGLEMRSVHSTYLEALTALGFVGFAIFMSMLFISFRRIWRVQKALRASGDSYNLLLGSALMAGYAGFLVSAVFLTRNYSEPLYYFPVFFAIFATMHERQARADEESRDAAMDPAYAKGNQARRMFRRGGRGTHAGSGASAVRDDTRRRG